MKTMHAINTGRFLATLTFAVLIMLTAEAAWSQEKEKEDREAVRKQRLEEMRKLVQAIKIEVGPADSAKAAKLKADPLLRFDDATREFYDGSVWLVGDSGRPHMLVAIERYPDKWSYELTLIAPPPISLTNSQGWAWKPRLPPFEDRTIMGAVPAERSVARKQEMSKLAERFTAVEFYGEEGRRQLRLMARPIWQYQDEKNGILDGAFFVYANGTNPEILLVLEARADKEGKRAWHYGLGRLGGAKMDVELDGKLVWEVQTGQGPYSQGPYAWYSIPFTALPREAATPK